MTNSETKAFNDDLDRYQAQEVAADKRDAWIEQQVAFLTSEGEEYYPFTPEHVQEAVTEASLADSIMLGSYAHVAAKFGFESGRLWLSDFLLKVVREYWEILAKFRAEQDYDTKWEL